MCVAGNGGVQSSRDNEPTPTRGRPPREMWTVLVASTGIGLGWLAWLT